jgi:hypothetical protein
MQYKQYTVTDRERKLLPLDYSSSNSQVIPTAVLGAANALHAYEPS